MTTSSSYSNNLVRVDVDSHSDVKQFTNGTAALTIVIFSGSYKQFCESNEGLITSYKELIKTEYLLSYFNY